MVRRENYHNKYCAEIFGYPPTNRSKEAEYFRKNKLCPFRGNDLECDPDNKISNLRDHNSGELLVEGQTGACTAWTNPRWSECPYPVIICPYRFFQNNIIFEFIKEKFFESSRIAIIDEVGIGGVGVVDSMAIEIDGDKMVHIEYQSDATTGTRELIKSIRDFNRGIQIWNNNYNYGLNSKASIKGSSLQMIMKGFFFQKLRIPSIWVMQDYLFKYMRNNIFPIKVDDVTRKELPNDKYLYFLITKLNYNQNEDRFYLRIDKLYVSTPEEMQRALAENIQEGDNTYETLLRKLREKLESGNVRRII